MHASRTISTTNPIAWAIWAIGIGLVTVAIFPIFYDVNPASPRRATRNNTYQVGLSLIMYRDYNDDFMPAIKEWNAKVMPFLKSAQVLNDPTLEATGDQRGIGLNPEACGKDLEPLQDPDRFVMLGQTVKPGKDAVVTQRLLRIQDERVIIGFWDGHAKSANMKQLAEAQWTPVLKK